MPEEGERQENKKTVVAFIAGLLIGGLLVWVFSSSPEQTTNVTDDSVETGEMMTDEEDSGDFDRATGSQESMVQEGSIVVSDQAAGNSVQLGSVRLPTLAGWIVVRDYMDGMPGNILGAARFNADEGLMPASVVLMRSTVPGSTYQVVFYTDDGDVAFNVGEDQLIEGISTTFTAQ